MAGGTGMNYWKELLIDAYRLATMPARTLRLRRWKRDNQVPLAVLFYHRVANDHPNPWTISEQAFVRQVDWLQKHFDLVSLHEVQRRIRTGNSRPAVSITFDDGYSDNCSFALPMLIERGIPVTYFVTTWHTAHRKPFPHDVEQGQPLAANSIESLKALSNAGVEIGAHTGTHVDLGSIDDQQAIYDEVIGATKKMEAMLDTSIRYFAFPFGQKENLNANVFQLLEDHNFSGVCSAYGGFNLVHGDSFHLRRIHGDPDFARFRNWLGYDPRLLRPDDYDWRSLVESTEPETGETKKENEPVGHAN